MRLRAGRYVSCLTVLGLALGAPCASATDLDSEAISQLSKGIAEWQLLNANQGDALGERHVCVSSSLGGAARKSPSSISIVHGLVAFNDTWFYESEIRDWELQTTVWSSERYAERMYDPYSNLRTIRDTAIKTELGMGVEMTSLGPLWTPASAVHTAVDTFYRTADRVGKSMQVMNPPIYLHEKTSYGWRGEGSYAIPGGQVHYQETLVTAGPGPITRTHTDWVTSDTGTYVRTVETKTPVANPFERFMMRHCPVGTYWDPRSTETYTTTWTQRSYRVEKMQGVERMTPLPNTGTTTWSGQNSLPTFDATWKTTRIGDSTYTYPSVDWNSGPRNSSIDWSRMNVGADAAKWGGGVGVNSYTVPPARIGSPLSTGTARYPPPDVLFSMKDPLTSYTPRLPKATISPYSTPSVPRIPAYQPLPTPSSSRLGGS